MHASAGGMRGRGHVGGSEGSMASTRASLFAGATAARLPSGGAASSGGGRGTVMRDALETDNDRMISDLERKVSALKGATQAIHDEVSEHNTILSGMSTDFSRTGGLMSATLNRLDGLIKYAGGSSHVCVIILFVVSVFLLLWYLTK